jgi:FkbM family methyltransferase
VLAELKRLDDALASYEQALAVRPDYPEALHNRAVALSEAARFDEALASHDRAVQLDPDNVVFRCIRASLLLLRGRFADGWREYEWRKKLTDRSEGTLSAPEWRGEDIRGKRLLLYSVPHFGDTIQFIRFARSATELGAKVIVAAPARLAALLRSSACDATIEGFGARLPDFDLRLPLVSMPFVLGFSPETSPAEVPYLSAEPARIEKWASRLPADGFKVGVAWQCCTKASADKERAIPLKAFAPLSRVPGLRLISLQKEEGLEQLANLPAGMTVTTLGDDFDAGPDAFLDTAAIMMSLDLVVTCDTAVAHLAGALGHPVWIVLKKVPDWRWLLDREDSPWYPTVRLFRQRIAGDWDAVFARVATELHRLVREKGEPSSPETQSNAAENAPHPAKTGLHEDSSAKLPVTVLKECRHGSMLFLRRDKYIGRSLDEYGEFSEFEASIFAQVLKPGDFVAEVGANIGALTVPIAKIVGEKGQVLAFEPQRVIFQLLCANVALNGLLNVRTYHAAAGREDGTITVPSLDYTAEANFGGLSLGASDAGETVQVLKLDSLSVPSLHLLKIDVEGMEADVLLGAQQTIAKYRPILYVENDRRAKSRQLIELLDSYGYRMWWHLPMLFNPNNYANNEANVFGGTLSVNLLCFPKEKPTKVIGLREVTGPCDWFDPQPASEKTVEAPLVAGQCKGTKS